MRTLYIILFLLFGLGATAQYARKYDAQDNAPKGKILNLFEEEGKLWYVYSSENLVYQKTGKEIKVGYYDGYDFYNFPLARFGNDQPNVAVDKLFSFQDSFLVVPTHMDHHIFLFNKITHEVIDLIDEPFYLGRASIHEGKLCYLQKRNGASSFEAFDGANTENIFDLPDIDNAFWFYTKDNFLLKKDYCNLQIFSLDGDFIREVSFDELEDSNPVLELEGCTGLYYASKYDGEDYLNINTEVYKLENNQVVYQKNHPAVGNIRMSIPDSEGNILYHQSQQKNQNFKLNVGKNIYPYPISDQTVEGYPHSLDFTDHIWFLEGGYIHYKKNDSNKKVQTSIDGSSIRHIGPLDDSKILVTSNTPGWFTIDRSTNKTEQLYSTKESSMIFPSFGVKKSDDGFFWSTKQTTIVKVKYPSEIIERYPIPNWHGLNGFTSIRDHLYLAVFEKIVRFNIKTKSIGEIEFDEKGKIEYLIENNGRYLLQCRSNGLYQYDVVSKQNTRISSDTSHYITCLVEDQQLLATTKGGRIDVFSRKNDTYIFKESHQVNQLVFCLERDQKGRLWLGTAKGIIHQKKRANWDMAKLRVSDQSSLEANRYSIYFDKTYNKMYIGTVKGLNTINTDFDYEEEGFNIVMNSFTFYEDDSLKQNTIWPNNEQLEIPHDRRYLQLKFADKKNIYNNSIKFEYQIDNQEWTTQNNQNTITLANLDGGQHTIKVRGVSDAGITSDNEIIIPVDVGKYFYETWWFRIGSLAVIGSLIFIWYRRITQENIRLETEVSNRTKELRRDKEIIEKQAEQLTKTDQMKNQFFSNISHELRTPLTLISSPIDQLSKMDLPEKAKYYLSLIDNNSDLLEDRVAELLELSRLEGGKVVLARNHIDLYKVVHSASVVFESAAKEKEIAFVLNIDVSNQNSILDKVRVTKIIQNLINNAIKFTPAHGKIEVDIKLDNDILSVKVSDDGIGISEEHKKHLFERFYQVPVENTMANPGTGLGLAMVAEYVELMNGKVDVESQLGTGTTFTVTIPIEKSQERLVIEESKNPIEVIKPEFIPTKTLNNQRPNILLAEDNDQLRSYIKTILQESYDVHDVANGQEALEYLENGQEVDIILSDIMMPKLDGVSLLKKVRSHAKLKVLPFIFITAKTNARFKVDMFRTGIDDYLTKPFSEDELKARLKAIYANYQTRINVDIKEYESEEETIDSKNLSSFEGELQLLIITNLQHPQFGTDFIAKKLGISRRTLQRILKKEIGLTPKQYIKEIKLNHGRTLYEENNYSTITELAKSVGFSNPSYFKQLYFERYGKVI